jgi:hypothetical protein
LANVSIFVLEVPIQKDLATKDTLANLGRGIGNHGRAGHCLPAVRSPPPCKTRLRIPVKLLEARRGATHLAPPFDTTRRASPVTYHDLVQLFFERSNALTWYWTVFIVVIGGLLGFSIFRQQRDFIKTVLITLLFSMFAYKNLDAIHDVTVQRFAVLSLIKEYKGEANLSQTTRDELEPTLGNATLDFASVRNFHVASALLTILTIWAMEWRRKRQEPDA